MNEVVKISVVDSGGIDDRTMFVEHRPEETPVVQRDNDHDCLKADSDVISQEAQCLRLAAEAILKRYESLRSESSFRGVQNIFDMPMTYGSNDDYITKGLRSVIDLLRILETEKVLIDKAAAMLIKYNEYVGVMLMAIIGVCTLLCLVRICGNIGSKVREVSQLYSFIKKSRLNER